MKTCLILMFLSIVAGIIFGTAPQFRPTIDHALSEAHLTYGLGLEDAGNPKEAWSEYLVALQLDPKNSDVYLVMRTNSAGTEPPPNVIGELFYHLRHCRDIRL
jgi:hypothetical protein